MLDLPTPSTTRLAVRLTSDAERHVRGGHPWVYDGSIVSVSPSPEDAAPGDLAVIFDKKRGFVAIGLFDPDSAIRIKILHVGKPRTVDASFFTEQIAAAVERRSELQADNATTGYRLVNGENDDLPGLIVDAYADHLVIKLYSTAWFAHLESVVNALLKALPGSTIVLRLSRNVQRSYTFGCHDGMVLSSEEGPPAGLSGKGSPGIRVKFLENDLTLEADVVKGQKTGHFLDQRENRARLAAFSAGKSVLDVFCCTGGFGLNAAKAGAKSVHAVDVAPRALENVRSNFDRNSHHQSVADCKLTTCTGDAFDELTKLAAKGQTFGVVVIDPPSFAQRQQDAKKALKAYRKLTALGLAVLAPGGTLVQASCSSRIGAQDFVDAVMEEGRSCGYQMNIREATGHAVDHPVTFMEGQYLKAIFATPSKLPRNRTPGRS